MNAAIAFVKNNGVLGDGELVVRALAGREDGFEELVRRYQRPMVAYIYRMTGNYESALDLTQEVFIKVYNSLARYDSGYKFSTWIYRIAHNCAIDHLRRQNKYLEELEQQNSDGTIFTRQIASACLTPEEQSEQAERRAEIETVVQELSPAYRELIVLRHAHDLSYDEIADITNLPLGTVKNRIFRAREAMRDALESRGIKSL
ncbi:MAG: sigma-70 family RNA polymerase sigma factor [Pyrinomonadaceae bacterium]